MAAAERSERPDATGETDQRRMAVRDVADADLGLGPVEDGVPARVVQDAECDEPAELGERPVGIAARSPRVTP